MNPSKRTLWRCPNCRRWLPQRNAVHACAPPVPLAAHFRGKSPRARQLYHALRTALKQVGPVRVDSTKTRIAFRVWTNFVEVTPQREALRGTLLLTQRARHPRFFRVVAPSPGLYYHFFKLNHPKQLDPRFRRLLAEAYKVGRREHHRRPGRKGRFVAAQVESAGDQRRRMGPAAPERPLWECPRCGKLFANRNQWHSCVRLSVDSHFQGKSPRLRRLFERLLAAVRRNGPVQLAVSKNGIAFMARMRFGEVRVRKDGLRGGLLLTRPASDPRFFRVISISPRCYGHSFCLKRPSEIDARLRRYLAEAYKVGRQEHLRGQTSPRRRIS